MTNPKDVLRAVVNKAIANGSPVYVNVPAATVIPATVYYDVEVTDTFGGEANYCWVHRHTIKALAGVSRRELVRTAKALEGWTGYRCETNDMGDTIEVRPRGLLQVMFITYRDE